jgi:nucleotide-binding universal stress UspA family protein
MAAHKTEKAAERTTTNRLIAVGLDFNEGARPAVARAAQIAKATGSHLLLVHAVTETTVVPTAPLPGDWTAPAVAASTPEGQSALVAQAEMAGKKLAAELEMPDVETVVRTGKPHDALAHVAERRGARIVVLGVHAPLTPGESFFLGSTAERTIRMGSTPVLLARRRDLTPYHKILVPVDLGELSMDVLRLLASTFPDAEYDLVHFLPHAQPTHVTAKERRVGFEASIASLAIGAGLDNKRTRVRAFVAEPRSGILGEVKSRGHDLVAMGTHARSGLARVLLGSVADYVIHSAVTADVLVVPPAR